MQWGVLSSFSSFLELSCFLSFLRFSRLKLSRFFSFCQALSSFLGFLGSGGLEQFRFVEFSRFAWLRRARVFSNVSGSFAFFFVVALFRVVLIFLSFLGVLEPARRFLESTRVWVFLMFSSQPGRRSPKPPRPPKRRTQV